MALSLRPGLTLYFARHGETEANVKKQFSGVKDTPLTQRGQAQAKAVGAILLRALGPQPACDFICSPLTRAKRTMEIARAALGLAPNGYRTDPRLQEIDLGIWDQLTDDEARALDPEFFARRAADKWHLRIPEGENYADVAKRLTSFVGDLVQDSVVISHGAATRILRGLFAGLAWQQMSDLDEPQGVVFRVRGDVVERLDP
ncbi:MAG TPA: histidine phosphatase family protein [Rhizomicrobium sp.]|nr:histidine phosphatase family protein [Rhizomicrobium sp.]